MFDKATNQTEPIDYLPEGFLDRTKDVGLVIRTLAPQEEILAHEATGGFVSHCGWNSVLESSERCAVIAWPLYSEQKNEEIAEMVKRVMDEEEGKEMRQNVKELKMKTAEEAVMKLSTPQAD